MCVPYLEKDSCNGALTRKDLLENDKVRTIDSVSTPYEEKTYSLLNPQWYATTRENNELLSSPSVFKQNFFACFLMSSIRHHVNSGCPDCLVQLGTLPRTFYHVSVAEFHLSKVEHYWQVMQLDCLLWFRFDLSRCSSRKMSMPSCSLQYYSQDPRVLPYRSGSLGWRQSQRKLAEIVLNL